MAFEPLFLANLSDIKPGHCLAVSLPNGREIVLFNVDGAIHALENACPHMGGPLCEGELEKERITCPWHGWQFDIRNGTNTTGLGDDAISIKILIKDDKVYLNEPF